MKISYIKNRALRRVVIVVALIAMTFILAVLVPLCFLDETARAICKAWRYVWNELREMWSDAVRAWRT